MQTRIEIWGSGRIALTVWEGALGTPRIECSVCDGQIQMSGRVDLIGFDRKPFEELSDLIRARVDNARDKLEAMHEIAAIAYELRGYPALVEKLRSPG